MDNNETSSVEMQTSKNKMKLIDELKQSGMKSEEIEEFMKQITPKDINQYFLGQRKTSPGN